MKNKITFKLHKLQDSTLKKTVRFKRLFSKLTPQLNNNLLMRVSQ